MIDTWALEKAFEAFVRGIPLSAWSDDLRQRERGVEREIYDVECEEDHVSDESTVLDGSKVIEYVGNLQTKLRMGTYSEALDGSLAEVLDEIERLLK